MQRRCRLLYHVAALLTIMQLNCIRNVAVEARQRRGGEKLPWDVTLSQSITKSGSSEGTASARQVWDSQAIFYHYSFLVGGFRPSITGRAP